ncbi:PAS domain S-box protein [Flavobacterium sp. UMI-01]|uniref:PAS domain S-box protein n=1 Tax=Flavobacterium sp. UMI-01 TaxID=1441053 RepID=UPI001C7D2FD4|nr:PAS domain S-box protein [Flavobacterium sp. UMI-01]GIZ10346.1 histidine kinase [Flavobacterium sp. UMI-01]
MKKPNLPHNESERLKELETYKIIGELESIDYDFLTHMAAEICGTKISLISLITEDKQWFLSHHGIDAKETPRDFAFCGHAINTPDEMFIVEDSTKDDRFFDNPLVTGAPKVIFYAGMPLVNENGFPLGTLCIIDDHPKKLTEEQINSLRMLSNQVIKLLDLHRKTLTLNKQNTRLKKITELFKESQRINHVGAWELDLETGTTLWTEEVYAIYEVDNDFDHNKEKAINYYHPEDRHIIINAIEKTLATEEPYDVVCRFISGKNNLKWVRSSGRVWKENGKTTKLIGIFQDITERKNTEDQLRISEQAFRGNFEHAAIGMALLDEKGRWLKVNKKLCDILGYSDEEFLNLTFQDITHPEDLASDLYLLKQLIQGKRDNYTLEKRYIHKNGAIVYIILAVSIVRNKDNEILYFVSQIVDITSLKTTELELANIIAYNDAIMDANTQVAIISTDTNGIIKTFNEGAENLLGYEAEELIGKETPQIIHLPEEMQASAQKHLSESGEKIEGISIFVHNARNGKAETKEWTYKRKDGSTFPVLLSISAIKQKGEITGFLGVATDITQMKQVEKETQELLEIANSQNNRLKNFAYIVSHNLRSHSGGISSLVELIEAEETDFSQTEIFEYLKKSSENLTDTIKHLTEVVQINLSDKEKLTPTLLHPVLDNNINSLMTQAKKANITIINEVDTATMVKAVPAYLDSIVMNFMTNAIKYRSEERESYLKIQTEKNPEYVILKFIDNGQGINLEKHGDKLFGMYKTFHNHADSRGIGLFITKNQIEAMNGKIEVESEINVGTTFKIYLDYEKN